jgi:hypothetical protein
MDDVGGSDSSGTCAKRSLRINSAMAKPSNSAGRSRGSGCNGGRASNGNVGNQFIIGDLSRYSAGEDRRNHGERQYVACQSVVDGITRQAQESAHLPGPKFDPQSVRSSAWRNGSWCAHAHVDDDASPPQGADVQKLDQTEMNAVTAA